MANKKEVIITCNATNVKAVIEGLERGMAALAKEEEHLLGVIKQRGYAENDEKKRLKELEKAMDAMRTNIQKNREETKKLGEVLKDLAGAKLKDLKKALQEGKAALNNMSARDPRRAQLVHDLQRIQKQIEANTGAIKSHGGAWQSAVRNITAYVGVFGAFNFVKNKIKEVITGGAELSDQMAQVRMVSGLAMEDIEGLTRTLAKIDTRTTLSELERISYAGAKLGFGEYGTQGLLEFTKAANQVNVALREDLGEEALTALSKITENMGLIKKMGVENAMLATSSAMFKLAATSTAAAGPIVEVTKRLVPVAQASGMATHEILALASASDSLQLMPEVVGTALSKLLMAMQNNHNLIEKTLEIPEGTISTMIKAGDVMQAMLLIFDKMSGKNMTELNGIWKLLGSDGQRLITVVQAMANHTDTLRKHLDTSTQAFKEATAVTEEYNIQQETAQAYLSRASNLWRNSMVNADSSLAVKEMAKSWYDFSKAVLQSDFSLGAIKMTIDFLLGSIKLLISLLPMITFGLLAKGAAMLASQLMLAKTSVDGFTLSWKKMDAATKANWISLTIGLLAQAAFSVAQWAKANGEAEASQKKLNLAMDNAAEKADHEINQMARLKVQVEDTTLATEERQKMFSKFKTDYDIYLNYLGIELKTVDDLAKHYDALTKVMKQRFAYQEREEYKRDVMGGEEGLRMKRRTAGSDLTRIAGEINEKVDLSVIDSYVASGLKPGQISNKLLGARPKGVNITMPTDKLRDAIVHYAQARLNETMKEAEIDKAFAKEIGDFDYDKYLRSQVKGDFVNKPDKDELKKQRAEEAAHRKALREEMKEEQTQAKAIIDNVKNYYQRQLNAITEMANVGTIDKTTQQQMTDGMTQRMNEALANVRKAIGGTKNDWESFKQSMRDDLYEPLNENGENFSTELLDKIMDNNLVKLREMIIKLSKALNQQGNVLLDQILRKATENEGKNAKTENKLMRARENELLERNYTGKVNLDYQNTMEQFGIAAITSDQTTQIRDMSQQGDTEGIKQFFANRTKLWREGFEQSRANILQLYKTEIKTEQDGDKLLTLLFGADYQQKLNGSELQGILNMSLDQWRVFYYKLIDYNDAWVDAQKKAYDESKKRQDYLFNNSPGVLNLDSATAQLQQVEQVQNLFGEPATFGRQLGMVDTISNDPEILRYDMLQARAEAYYNKMLELRLQDLVSEEQVKDARDQLTNAQIASQQKLMAVIQARTQTLTNAIQPITDFAENAGQKLGDMIFNMESQSMTWNQIWKSMLLAMGKSIIQMGQQYAIQQLQRSLFNKQIEADETLHQSLLTAIALGGALARMEGEFAIDQGRLIQKKVVDGQEITEEVTLATSLTSLGISEGAAKTIGSLGWWGIPLIAVISALLMGLLTSALSTAGSASSSSSTASVPKTKLASGMLTYDEGNIGTYQGSDGQSYRAAAVSAPADGLVTQPIATTVQGQPALVAERGPEIVIGRRTTRAIMMNEPGLIRYLANYNKNASAGPRYRTFDEGNLDTVNGQWSIVNGQSSMVNGQLTREDAAALTAAIGVFNQTVGQLQQKGIPCYINKYGTGGLIEEVKSGLKFDSKYNGK